MPEILTEEQENAIANLIYEIEDDGLDYALRHYSHWEEIEDIDPALYKRIRELTEKLEDFSKYMKRYKYIKDEMGY